MHRRDFLKFLLSTPIALTLDVDKLLWVPGEKTIFIPPARSILNESAIIEAELARIAPFVHTLFDRDDVFYKIFDKKVPVVSSREVRIPLSFEPGKL